MRTEQLIDILSTNIDPVDRRTTHTALTWAVIVGAAAAFGVMVGTVSPREDLTNRENVFFVLLKLAFALAVMTTGLLALTKSVRPGRSIRKTLRLLWLPFLAVGVAAVADLTLGLTAIPRRLMVGTDWLLCLYCIPLFAIIPFALLVWALHAGAPTNLRQTGAVAGLVAGAIGAAAYAFHCQDDALPFIAVWYTASIGACSFIGATLGPRLLRW